MNHQTSDALEYRLLTQLTKSIQKNPIVIRNRKNKDTLKWISKNAGSDFLFWLCETSVTVLTKIPANHSGIRGFNPKIKSFLKPKTTVVLKKTDLIRTRFEDELLENIRSDVNKLFKKSRTLKGFKSFKADALPYLEERMAQLLLDLHSVDLVNINGLPGTEQNREKFLYELLIYLTMDRLENSRSIGPESQDLSKLKAKWTEYLFDRLQDASKSVLSNDKADLKEFQDLKREELKALEKKMETSPRYFHVFISMAKNLPKEVDRFDDIWKKYARDRERGLFKFK